MFEILWYSDRSITDTPVYFDYASRIARGMVPYRDFASEYPPVAMLVFSLPRLLSGPSYDAFVIWFQVEMLVFSCGIVTIMSLVAWRLWRNLSKVAGVLGLYTFFVLALGSIVESRFDLAAAFIILASIACFLTDRYLFAWILLGVGLMTKVVPVLIAPVFLIAHYRRRQYGELWMGPLVLVLSALIVAIPFLISSPAGLANAFLYHVERPLQIESTWASPVLLLAKIYRGYHLQILNAYGSHNVYATGTGFLATISGPVTAVFLLLGYLIFFRRSGENRCPESESRDWTSGMIIRYAIVAVATFIVGGKVMSPQFLIWLLPLAPLIKGGDRRLVLSLFGVVLVLTQVEFPFSYWQLYSQHPAVEVEVALRNAVLALTTVFIAFGQRSSKRVSVSDADALVEESPAQSSMPG